MSEADRIMAAIRTWEPDEQQWWRALLDVAPDEALFVARLALELDARPRQGEDFTEDAPEPL